MDLALLHRIQVFGTGTIFRTSWGLFRLDERTVDLGMKMSCRNPKGEWEKVSPFQLRGHFLGLGVSPKLRQKN